MIKNITIVNINQFLSKIIASKVRMSWIRRVLFEKLKLNKFFKFNSVELEYFFHSYNNFRLSERCIEIPLIKLFLKQIPHHRVLEIGNVTKHYYNDFKEFKEKDTLDKFETAFDVINLDIKEYKTEKKYDFIYSLSTFEHMDSDINRNPDYVPKGEGIFSTYAFEYMNMVIKNLLDKKGKFIITFPIGYGNCEIDGSLYNLEYSNFKVEEINIYLFKRIDELNWKQVDIEEGRNYREGKISSGRNFLCLMEIKK